jgi:hypothetical protein
VIYPFQKRILSQNINKMNKWNDENLNENKDGDRNSSRKCQSLQEPIRVILESN